MLEREQFVTTTTSGVVGKWVHPAVIARLNGDSVRSARMCNGAVLGFSVATARDAYDKVLTPFATCSLAD